jgi:Fe2+ transport system protein FeoA
VTPATDIQALQLPAADASVVFACDGKCAARSSGRKGLRLSDLRAGETGRVLRVATADPGCRKRFAELGLAEGMKVTVRATGDVLMIALGGGAGSSRMGLAARCADEIFVSRIASK